MSKIESSIIKVDVPDLKPETPTKLDSSYTFTSRETNKVQQQELSKTVYSHISKLHILICDWNKNRVKGNGVAALIYASNLPQYEEDYFPSELKPLMYSLVEILDTLNNILDDIKVLNNQLQALAKLQPTNEPVLVTWSVSRISIRVMEIYENTKKEYELLQNVTENIAHCRDENLLGVYVGTWRTSSYVRPESYAYLFSEAGLSPLT